MYLSDQMFLKYSYLFNPNNIAKRAAAKIIAKNFIKNDNFEDIIEFLNKEKLDMEIIMNLLLIEDSRIENFQINLLQKFLIEKWNKNEKLFLIFIKLSSIKHERLRTSELQPLNNTNIYLENLDKKSKLKLEQILNLINIFNNIKEYHYIVDLHLKDFINTLHEFEESQKFTNESPSNHHDNIPNNKSFLISKFEKILFSK
ncbi:hypothetical protein BCR32DRAFT_249267 [Anaeromyces robustus]|uniref:Uncharacterized protein n=1 Tax=Anaeromyces robustus TaxID=1754192 RepID=A0A1Y1WQI6_9FUNG|nr:hypothetical protein BCR32DRAFT_249267 [Anaeromyces robustus]|eukprot:ORX75797.1 hypothetical protein BCR32DRAFT_249267 [Anaeromyces robustus]